VKLKRFNMQDKITRLEDLLLYIKDYERREHYFSLVFHKLQDEHDLEFEVNPDFRSNGYLNNLRQTIEKQANAYNIANLKKSKRGHMAEYTEFIDNFKSDINEELFKIRPRPSIKNKEV
jgi:hypothetical protein